MHTCTFAEVQYKWRNQSEKRNTTRLHSPLILCSVYHFILVWHTIIKRMKWCSRALWTLRGETHPVYSSVSFQSFLTIFSEYFRHSLSRCQFNSRSRRVTTERLRGKGEVARRVAESASMWEVEMNGLSSFFMMDVEKKRYGTHISHCFFCLFFGA